MTELDEVAEAIYLAHQECWPVTRKQAEALAWVYCHHETQQIQDGVADVLMTINSREIVEDDLPETTSNTQPCPNCGREIVPGWGDCDCYNHPD